MNAEVNNGNRKAVLASNYTLRLRIRGRHAGVNCDLKGINIVRLMFGRPEKRNINCI